MQNRAEFLASALASLAIPFVPSSPKRMVLTFAPGQSARWNPLSHIRIGTILELADARSLAMIVCDPSGEKFAGHFSSTADGIIESKAADIKAEIYSARESGRNPVLSNVFPEYENGLFS